MAETHRHEYFVSDALTFVEKIATLGADNTHKRCGAQMNAFAVIAIGALVGACGGLWVALLTEQRKRYMAERELADISKLLAVYAKRSSYIGHFEAWDGEDLSSNVVKFGKSA